jgi:hypothetical protein
MRGSAGLYKLDATVGMTGGLPELAATSYDPNAIGAVERIVGFAPPDRSSLASYRESDLLEEVYDKACGGCHLYSAGRNDRYGDFRGSGCSACHVAYNPDGRSQSSDERIAKGEPSYPEAYSRIAGFDPSDLGGASWVGPERPHPRTHQITTQMNSQRCGSCHSGSNRTELQYRGYQIDPNRTATRALDLFDVAFTDEMPNDAAARIRGFELNQILRFSDWDGDDANDIPADVHYSAGLECIDCHTSKEMHGDGTMWSRRDQATEVECSDCHGTVEARALPFPADNRNPIRRLIACPEDGEIIPNYETPTECLALGKGRFLRASLTSDWHYVSQVRDSVDLIGSATDPDGARVYTLEASIFHGRVDGDSSNGTGPCIDGDANQCFLDQVAASGAVENGFSHLDRVDCTSCHAAWTNSCWGCHVTLDDTARDFSPATGEYTLGRITQAEPTWISPLDRQLGIDGEGMIAPFTSAGGLRLRHVEADGQDWFGRRSIVAGDASIRYGVYRHRTGYGLRPYDQEGTGLLPNADGPVFEQRPQMNDNAAFGFNPITPHTTQRTHGKIDCTNCHLGGDGEDPIQALYGVRTEGFGGLSAVLSRLDGLELVRSQSGQRVFVNAALGYRLDGFSDPDGRTIGAQLDRIASSTGFPYASTNHPLRTVLDERHRRDYPTIAPLAGPLGPNLLPWLSGIIVLPRGVN